MLLTVAACGSSTTTSGSGGAAGTNPESGSSVGGASPIASGAGLTGTWDLLASVNGEVQSGSLILSSTELVIAVGGDVLSYKVNGSVLSVSWSENGHSSSIPVTRIADTKSSASYGSIPLALDGTWSFGPDDEQVVLTVFPGYVGATANNYVDFPYPLPEPDPGQVYTAEQDETHDSIFGDLGGAWHANASGDEPACAVGFQGNDFTASCEDDESTLHGDVSLTFDSSLRSASGAASGNVELSAKRR